MVNGKKAIQNPPIITIGFFIRKAREEQGISQEALCHGICAVSNLSRIENNAQMPTNAKLEALLQRLGITPDLFPSFLNEQELEAYQLRHEINVKFDEENFLAVETLLGKMEKKIEGEQTYKNFITLMKTMLLWKKSGTTIDILEKLKNLINISIKNFSIKKIPSLALCKSDIFILEHLALAFYDLDEKENATDILYALKDYMERRSVHFKCVASNYIKILYTLSKWAGASGHNEEVLELCEKGLLCCAEYGIPRIFGKLLFNKGDALLKLDRKSQAIKSIEESYYFERVFENNQVMETIMEYARVNSLDVTFLPAESA